MSSYYLIIHNIYVCNHSFVDYSLQHFYFCSFSSLVDIIIYDLIINIYLINTFNPNKVTNKNSGTNHFLNNIIHILLRTNKLRSY